MATWAIHPALPTGMHFNTGNGTITGTPSVNQTATTYTIYANNSGGDASSTVSITIDEPMGPEPRLPESYPDSRCRCQR